MEKSPTACNGMTWSREELLRGAENHLSPEGSSQRPLQQMFGLKWCSGKVWSKQACESEETFQYLNLHTSNRKSVDGKDKGSVVVITKTHERGRKIFFLWSATLELFLTSHSYFYVGPDQSLSDPYCNTTLQLHCRRRHEYVFVSVVMAPKPSSINSRWSSHLLNGKQALYICVLCI